MKLESLGLAVDSFPSRKLFVKSSWLLAIGFQPTKWVNCPFVAVSRWPKGHGLLAQPNGAKQGVIPPDS